MRRVLTWARTVSILSAQDLLCPVLSISRSLSQLCQVANGSESQTYVQCSLNYPRLFPFRFYIFLAPAS